MKDLPSVSAVKIDKIINNSQDRFYGSGQEIIPVSKKESVTSKINKIFASNNHVYKSRVRIKLSNDTYEKYIIGKTSTDLLTMNGEKIHIKDIIDIEKI